MHFYSNILYQMNVYASRMQKHIFIYHMHVNAVFLILCQLYVPVTNNQLPIKVNILPEDEHDLVRQ